MQLFAPLNSYDISFLIESYAIVADSEIHSNEIKAQKTDQQPSKETKDECAKILSDDPGKIPLDSLIDMFMEYSNNEEEKNRLVKRLLKIIYADGFYDTRERKVFDYIIKKIDFPKSSVAILENEVKNELLDDKYVEKEQSFLERAKETASKVAYKITGSEIFEGNLLNGKEFVDKVKEIGERAKEDLQVTRKNMKKLNGVLSDNYKIIEKIEKNKREDKESKELIDFIAKINKEVGEDIAKMIASNLEMLNKKERTIDYFTIAFMGRTKAGKSTFHKVITGEKTDDIGVGKLRTTRYNRVFNWENIRIIDTPGIGAPGGREDTEIARAIVDEADLICYVVTNDSIQETEFNFLSELKEKNKPLFIILNYKENLENDIRLNRFLENPQKWMENKGNKSIKGHIDRIHEMVEKNNYSPEFIEIIPIHLLAAQMGANKSGKLFEQDAKRLQQGSNIGEYSKRVKQTVFRSGNLKKSQNIVDGSNFYVADVVAKVGRSLSQAGTIARTEKQKKRAKQGS